MSNGNNTGLSTIADRYATALIELGEKTDQLDIFSANLDSINATLAASPDLSIFLEHPTITLGDKKDVIEKIFSNLVSQHILNLLKLLLDRNRMFIFPSLVHHYNEILNKKRNIAVANVVTAIEINEDIKSRIKMKLENILNQNINIKTKVDPDIIAGMIIQIGDRTIDGSIRTRLENMRRQLI